MSNLINFNFENHQVRTALKGNEPYFCLSDVTEILDIKNSRHVVTQLDEKGIEKIAIQTKGGVQEVTFINEPNLYRVIFRSNKAEARQFQDWVFNEVLPSIRQTGSYSTKLTEEQAYHIKSAVERKCKDDSIHYQTLWTALKHQFKVRKYELIEASDFDQAMAFIENFQPPKEIDHQPLNIHEFLNRQSNQIMDYVHGLEQAVFSLTGKYPQRPFNRDDIAKGVIGACLNHQTIELNFSESGLGFNLVDRTTLRIHDSNIAEHIKLGNVSTKYLDDIIQASVSRLA